jgi:hypothetical protein
MHVDPSVDYRVEATGTRSYLDRGNPFRVPVAGSTMPRFYVKRS